MYHEEDGHITVEKCGNDATGPSVVYLRCLHCTHPSNCEFKRLICFASGKYLLQCTLTIALIVSALPVYVDVGPTTLNISFDKDMGRSGHSPTQATPFHHALNFAWGIVSLTLDLAGSVWLLMLTHRFL